MSYVLKDHIGSLYATVTDGEVEYYSFDAWGRERNHNTLQYDNINTTFDRGFCMHEHYRDFGLINMNGRLYDPLVGRMLSPDIVIQDPEYSQSYNRYSYCFNNPLRFTDPSGYVVTIPPEFEEFFDVSSFMDLNSFTKYLENKGGDKVTYNTEQSEGKTITNISWKLADDNYNITIIHHLIGEYSSYCENSCVADAISSQEQRFIYGNDLLTPEYIMSQYDNSCKNGLNVLNSLNFMLKNTNVYKGRTFYPLKDSQNNQFYEEMTFKEMKCDNGIFFSVKGNTELSHIVNVSHAIEFSINGTNKGHEVIIWDPMFKQETNGCYRQLFDFYDRNKLYINIGIMFHKNNYK